MKPTHNVTDTFPAKLNSLLKYLDISPDASRDEIMSSTERSKFLFTLGINYDRQIIEGLMQDFLESGKNLDSLGTIDPLDDESNEDDEDDSPSNLFERLPGPASLEDLGFDKKTEDTIMWLSSLISDELYANKNTQVVLDKDPKTGSLIIRFIRPDDDNTK